MYSSIYIYTGIYSSIYTIYIPRPLLGPEAGGWELHAGGVAAAEDTVPGPAQGGSLCQGVG